MVSPAFRNYFHFPFVFCFFLHKRNHSSISINNIVVYEQTGLGRIIYNFLHKELKLAVFCFVVFFLFNNIKAVIRFKIILLNIII